MYLFQVYLSTLLAVLLTHLKSILVLHTPSHLTHPNQPFFPDVLDTADTPLNPAISLNLDLIKKLHLYLTKIRGGK